MLKDKNKNTPKIVGGGYKIPLLQGRRMLSESSISQRKRGEGLVAFTSDRID